MTQSIVDSAEFDKKDATFAKDFRAHDEVANTLGLPASLMGLSPEEMKKLQRATTWKVDLLIMPSLIIMYILNYLDRQNIAAAKLANLTQDLNINATQYQECISLLFVGYIIMQVPSNMIASKVAWPGTYICVAMGLWGIISAGTGAVQSFGGLLACRFILGFVEAVFFPGAIFFLSTWYTKRQLATRAALLYSGSQLGNAFGTLLALAILKLDGAHGIEGWRWLFIVEGALTVGIAIIFAFTLPNKPHTAKALSDLQRDYLVWELAAEQGAQDDSHQISAFQGAVLAFKDPKTYLLMGVLHCTYVAAAVVSFFPSVVGTLGYSRNITYCLTAPPYILTVIVMIINGWHSDRTQERFWHIVCPLFFSLISFIIAISTLNTAARYVAMMLMPSSLYCSAIVTLSWIAGSLTQPVVKRSVALAFINAVSNTPNIWTPFLYNHAPRYLNAFAMNLAAVVVTIGFAVATRLYLQAKNRQLDQGINTARGGPTAIQFEAGFRYTI